MNTSVIDQLVEAFQSMFQTVVEWTPRVVMGILIVILALLGAKVIERILRAFLTRVRFDQLLAKAGIDQILNQNSRKQKALKHALLLFLL